MTTIQQVVDIPEDHRLRLDLPLPEDIPAGRAEIRVTIVPHPEHSESAPSRKPFEGLAGCLKEDSAFFRMDPVEYQRRIRDEW